MNTHKTFVAKDMFTIAKTPLSEFFSLSMHATISQCLIGKTDYGYTNGKGHWVFGFYPNEALLKTISASAVNSPRVMLEFKTVPSSQPAVVRGEIQAALFACPPSNDRGELVSGFFELELPDLILGLDDIANQHKGSLGLYRGLFFNLTPGEDSSNLYDLFDKVAKCTALTYLAMEANANEIANSRRLALA